MKTSTAEIKKQFCDEYEISLDELENRMYSVDSSKPVTLINLLNINTDAVCADDLFDLVKNYGFPMKEILALTIGETYFPIGAMGADVKRVK